MEPRAIKWLYDKSGRSKPATKYELGGIIEFFHLIVFHSDGVFY